MNGSGRDPPLRSLSAGRLVCGLLSAQQAQSRWQRVVARTAAENGRRGLHCRGTVGLQDSPLEGDGFEPLVPRHAKARDILGIPAGLRRRQSEPQPPLGSEQAGRERPVRRRPRRRRDPLRFVRELRALRPDAFRRRGRGTPARYRSRHAGSKKRLWYRCMPLEILAYPSAAARRARGECGELIDRVAAGAPVRKLLLVETVGHMRMPFTAYRLDHNAGIQFPAIDAHRAAEAAAELFRVGLRGARHARGKPCTDAACNGTAPVGMLDGSSEQASRADAPRAERSVPRGARIQ